MCGLRGWWTIQGLSSHLRFILCHVALNPKPYLANFLSFLISFPSVLFAKQVGDAVEAELGSSLLCQAASLQLPSIPKAVTDGEAATVTDVDAENAPVGLPAVSADMAAKSADVDPEDADKMCPRCVRVELEGEWVEGRVVARRDGEGVKLWDGISTDLCYGSARRLPLTTLRHNNC